MNINKTYIPSIFSGMMVLILTLMNLITPSVVKAQQMVVESLNGPVTQKEIDAFKTYMTQKVQLPEKGSGNVWVFGYAGKAIEACGLMYEATHDIAILDRMIYYCDAALAGRNDLAPANKGGQLKVWTGKIEPVWPSGTGRPAGAGVEQGSVLAHMAFCAKLILQNPSIWNNSRQSFSAPSWTRKFLLLSLQLVNDGQHRFNYNYHIPPLLSL